MAGKIFICYRRGDEPGFALRLYEALGDSFGVDNLFFDKDSIPPGFDFTKYIEAQIASSEFVLVVIGRDWLAAADAQGRRRLDSSRDFVRVEIESALKQGKHVVPILVHGAAMPTAEELPSKMRELAVRNAFFAPNGGSRAEFTHLVISLQKAVAILERMRDAAQLRTQQERVRKAEELKQAEVARVRSEEEQAAKIEAALAQELETSFATFLSRGW